MAKATRLEIAFWFYNRTCQLFERAIPWAGLVGFGYVTFYLPVAAAPGQETTINHIAKLVAEFSADQWTAYILAAGGVGYGYYEKRLRRDTVARYSDRVRMAEQQADPQRSSSELTPRGETPPEGTP